MEQRLQVVPMRRWRHYATPSGRRPTREFIETLAPHEYARLASAMRAVAENGTNAARHLRGDLYEVRTQGTTDLRVIFATEGRWSHILLALHAFSKKSQRTPQGHLRLAEDRLRGWRARGT